MSSGTNVSSVATAPSRNQSLIEICSDRVSAWWAALPLPATAVHGPRSTSVPPHCILHTFVFLACSLGSPSKSRNIFSFLLYFDCNVRALIVNENKSIAGPRMTAVILVMRSVGRSRCIGLRIVSLTMPDQKGRLLDRRDHCSQA